MDLRRITSLIVAISAILYALLAFRTNNPQFIMIGVLLFIWVELMQINIKMDEKKKCN